MQKRDELIPTVARVFAELGYRRTTTVELAERCGVQETILYRLWPDKRSMFIAAIHHVHELSVRTWERLLDGRGPGTAAERLLAYEAAHLGEFGHARIIFAGLSETDDPEIRRALAVMYRRYQEFIQAQVGAHRAERTRRSPRARPADAALAAWAMIGLGTVATIARELELLGAGDRTRLLMDVGGVLLGGQDGATPRGAPRRR
jgi:AcrR family transcriptional regulator